MAAPVERRRGGARTRLRSPRGGRREGPRRPSPRARASREPGRALTGRGRHGTMLLPVVEIPPLHVPGLEPDLRGALLSHLPVDVVEPGELLLLVLRHALDG